VNNSLFSVIIPTYNRLDRLRVCLPTFLSTKLQGVEFIIVDNCSTDGTWPYLKELASNDKRLRILQNPQNIGMVKNWLRCYCEVKSPFALFLSDDDKLEGDYITQCYEIFVSHSQVGLVHHFASGWKHNVADQMDNYVVHKSGEDAQRAICMITGAYPGIAFRMNNFDLGNFSLDAGAIYPQVKASLLIARNYDVAIIKKCGIVSPDWGESVAEKFKEQDRPNDFGLIERISYLNKYASSKILFHFVRCTIPWYINCVASFIENSQITLFQITSSIPKYYFNLLTLLYILKQKKFKILVYFLLTLVINPIRLIYFIKFSFILTTRKS